MATMQRRALITANNDKYTPTGVFLGRGDDRVQVYLNTVQASRQPLAFEFKPGDVTLCDSFEQARRRYDAQLAEKDAERAERKRKNNPQALVPVSVVGSNLEGDYQLAGFHASQGTPLLRDESGKPVVIQNRSAATVLERLTPEQWSEWQALDTADKAAQAAWDALDELKPDDRTFRPSINQQLTLAGWRDDPTAVVDWSLDGEQFLAVIGEQEFRADSLDELSKALLDVLHPDTGKPCLVVHRATQEREESIEYRPYLASDDARFDRTTWYLGLSEERYRALEADRNSTRRATRKFKDEHAYHPSEENDS